jgi:thiol:disulfide interchange protein DsbA
MLKNITKFILALLLTFASVASQANEAGYETLTPPQPTENPDKIEIIEFFWYGCPHCYAFEPLLEQWVKTLPKNVEFIRQPAVFSEAWGKHAKAYYTAEALGIVDKVHNDFFDAIQNKKEPLDTEASLAKFFADHGVKEADFHDAYNNFGVDAKLRQAPIMASKYGITGVPAIIINGKYKTNGTVAGSHEKMIEVMNKLIKEESTKK